MRKALIAIAAVAAIVLIVVLVSGGGGDNNGYIVRGIFDNSSFMVEGEEVRVAGATVGEIESVDVTMPGEVDSYSKAGKPEAIPGKAVLEMKITDPGFQDFRKDASCLIRPQSLIGEKFVDCQPTLPRAPGSKPPPELEEIPDGQPGAGQFLLPLENNSTSVDPDLVNNIQRLPYSQRFRIILNEFGAGLAARGEDIEEAVKRANPALRDADRFFAILANQRDQLNKLAADSEQILGPLSRQRAHFAGFFVNSGAAAEATTERGEELEASLRKLPQFMREFRTTLRSLQGFSNSAVPVFTELGRAAPTLTSATRALTPFSAASTVSLKSLGAAGEASGPTFHAATPVVRTASRLARSGVKPTSELAKFLVSIRKTKGFDRLVDTIYSGAGAVNEFDQYGHFIRTLVAIVDCTDYQLGFRGQCNANFTGAANASVAPLDIHALYQRAIEEEAKEGGGTAAGSVVGPPLPSISEARPPAAPEAGQGEGLGEGEGLDEGEASGAETPEATAQKALLDYFLKR
jgi:ABC-type transporter Mla subunit MlaD